jgi:hypothetical protein
LKADICDRRIPQSYAESLASLMELDLIAFFRVLQDDLLSRIEAHEGLDPEELLELIGKI